MFRKLPVRSRIETDGTQTTYPATAALRPVERCARCGKRPGFFLGVKGFGWRMAGHDARCAKRFERRLQNRVDAGVSPADLPIPEGVGADENVVSHRPVDNEGAVHALEGHADSTPAAVEIRGHAARTSSSSRDATEISVPTLSPEEEREALQVFELCDEDKSGTVTMHEFAALCVKHPRAAKFIGLSKKQLGTYRLNSDVIFSEMGDGTRGIAWDEFKLFVARRRSQLNLGSTHTSVSSRPSLPADDKITQIFRLCDKDSSGTITMTELAAFCMKRPQIAKFIGMMDSGQSSPSRRRPRADVIFKEMDIDDSKTISLQEFRDFIAKHCSTDELDAIDVDFQVED